MRITGQLLGLLAILVATSFAKDVKETDHKKQDGKYLIYYPSTAYMDENLQIIVSIFNATSDTHLTIKLLESLNKTVIVSVEEDMKSETTKTINLAIPFLVSHSHKLEITGTGGVVFNEEEYIYFQRERTKKHKHEIFIQTDKPLYKPKDKVQFRVFGLHPDLRTSKSPLNVSIVDPKGNIMKRFINEKPETGVASLEYILSDQPVMGNWHIEMKQEGKKEKYHFEVKEYVLPTYKVTVTGDKKIPTLGYGYLFIEDQMIHINVSAKYTFGKAVRGDLFLNASIDDKEDGLTRHFAEKIDGHHHLVLKMKDFKNTDHVKVSRYQSFCTPRKITFRAMVVEALTGKKMHAEPFVTEFVNSPIKIEIGTPIIFKRGLPKKVNVTVKRVDGKHLTAEDRKYPLNIVSEYGHGLRKDINYTIPENGSIQFDFLVPPIERGAISIKATYKGYHGSTHYETKEKVYPTEFSNEHKDNLEAILLQERVNVGGDIKVLMNSTAPIEYALITTVSNNKILNHKIMKVDKKTSFVVEIPTTEEMIPSASVVISCITTKGDLMVDASTAKITIAFKNHAVGLFTKEEGQPGTNVDFKLKTKPGSEVFVMAVDKSLHLLESAKYISEDMIYDALVGHQSSNYWRRNVRNINDVLDSVDLHLMTNYIEVFHIRIYSDNVARFEVSNRRLSAGAMDTRGPMGPVAVPFAANAQSIDTPRIRKFFPETWIWEHGKAGESGEYIFNKEVPDSITKWQANAFSLHPEEGLGIMKEPAEFLSHKDFFIHPVLPYSLIRGESFTLKVSIFSNLSQDQEVTVTLLDPTSFTVSDSETSKKVMLKSFKDQTVQFEVTPTVVGDIPIKIRAECELASDEIHKKIILKPEGYTIYKNKILLVKVVDGAPEEIDHTFPEISDIVPDSQRLEVSVMSDVMGSAYENLRHLIRLPSGCGEQNMINFAPNIYIYNYLKATNLLTDQQSKRIIRYTEAGYQNQLQYQLSDGSFSAFGKRDKKGSTWLTAFVLRCFGQARKTFPEVLIDENLMKEGLNWLARKRNRHNRFKEDGRIIHGAMQGESGEGDALTTYVLISLFENEDLLSNVTKPIVAEVAASLPIHANDSYNLGMMLYLSALMKNSERFDTIQTILEEQSIKKDDMMYWPSEEKEESYYHSASTGIELASYVLMAYTEQGMIEEALPIMKWIKSHQNSLGGYYSTQDTVLAIESAALLSAKLKPAKSLDVTITPEGGKAHTITATKGVLHKYKLPSDTKKTHIKVDGTTQEDALYTYSLVQISRQYNIKLGSADSIFEGKVEYHTESPNEMKLNICHRMKKMNLTGMILIEAELPSGYSLINKKHLLNEENISKVELKHSTVVLYLNELTTKFSCHDLLASKVFEVKGHVSPLPVSIRLYYQPDLKLVTMYQITGGSE